MKIGILGAAKIAPKALIGPARDLGTVEVAAVACRDARRAELFAAEHGIERVHSTYDELINDADLDAVYVPLPVSEHARWSIAALEAGRHVLCEKPFALNAPQAQQMVDVGIRTDRRLVEAMHWRYYPLAARLLELTRLVGPLTSVNCRFEAPISRDDIRFQYELGGGATMDLGCYPVHWLRTIVGEEPEVLDATSVVGPTQVDVAMRAHLRFASGCTAQIECEMVSPERMIEPVIATLNVVGQGGRFTALNPQAPHIGARLVGQLADGIAIDEVPDYGTTYLHQLKAFERIVAGQEIPLTGGADAVANMRVIDEIYVASGLDPRG